MRNTNENIIEVMDLKNRLDGQWVHKGLSFNVKKGEIIAIIGSSGCGKTILLKSILKLHKPTSGKIKVFGIDITSCSTKEALEVQHRWGVMFQNLALFSSLKVWENIIFQVHQFGFLKPATQKQLALLKLATVGLERTAARKYPSEISGGMAKRVALARAIVLDPELVFLDEPTSGLDPIGSRLLDELVLEIRRILGVTFITITHDPNSLKRVPDRVLFLGDGKVLDYGPIAQVAANPHPLIQEYFADTHMTYTEKQQG